MQALIDFLIRNLMALWPVARIYSWEQGVMVRNGQLGRLLSPGLHWRWWFVDEVYRAITTEQTIDLRVGTITTSDGQSVAISANITYRVRNIHEMWSHVFRVETSLRDLGLGFLARQCSEHSWEDLQNGRGDLQHRLTEHMSAGIQEWGVEITRVHLTDMVRARPFRFFGNTAA